jgi:NAD(P)-dependent dehydrogenase (short-subunit alcohol dehydrogenase family)
VGGVDPAGRVAVVTGASAGVGRATARLLARRGYDVGALSRGEGGLRGVEGDVRSAGQRCAPVSCDVSDAGEVETAAAKIEAELGPIDVWINNAFSALFAPFWEIAADEYQRATEVSYLGYVYGTMAALRRMRSRDTGSIVQVGSALAYRGIPLQSAYCGAKHAIQGFTESLRCELLHERSGVRVTMVQLPAVNTPQFSWVLSRLPRQPQPVPPIYEPELPARAIAYAAEHPDRHEYWVGGTTAATIVANALAPGLLDRYLGRTGFSSQQTEEPVEPDRPANLRAPADERDDFGAHGAFDDRSHPRSVQWWATSHRRVLWPLAGGLALLAARAASRR